MRRQLLVLIALGGACAAAGVATAVVAKTIVGSARAERINGSSFGDAIYAGAGNDTIYGYGGNDRIYPGAGADRVFCGTGNDVVYRGAGDSVARDCEIVRAAGRTTPPPPPATGARYVGTTGQTGKALSFHLTADGQRVAVVQIDYKASCSPSRDIHSSITVRPSTPIGGDHKFRFVTRVGRDQIEMDGELTPDRTLARGTFQVQTGDGCNTSDVPWNAHRR